MGSRKVARVAPRIQVMFAAQWTEAGVRRREADGEESGGGEERWQRVVRQRGLDSDETGPAGVEAPLGCP